MFNASCELEHRNAEVQTRGEICEQVRYILINYVGVAVYANLSQLRRTTRLALKFWNGARL
jgi:hypothetical protein